MPKMPKWIVVLTRAFIVFICVALMGCGRLLSAESNSGLESPLPSDVFDGGDNAVGDADVVRDDAAAPYVFIPTLTTPLFTDDFTRSDGPDIGNGWIERVPSSFALVGSAAECLTEGATDQLVRRSETFTDLEIGARFSYGSSIIDEPSLYLRLQADPPALGFIGYRAYLIATRMTIENRTSSGSGALAKVGILPSLVVGRTYRFYFRIAGKDPVVLEAGLFNENGVSLASVRAVDPYPTRIVAAGWAAFGSRVVSTRWEHVELYP